MCGVAQVAPGAFGVYVHVPYCASRCGYCDFNTYTAAELGPGLSRATYADDVIREIDLAAAVLDGRREIATVFFGGGTPTLLPAADLVRWAGLEWLGTPMPRRVWAGWRRRRIQIEDGCGCTLIGLAVWGWLRRFWTPSR